MYFATFAFYNEDKNTNNNTQNNCIICLLPNDTPTDKIKKMTDFVHISITCPCNPPIHFQCINQWIYTSSTCPICRKPIYSKWHIFWNNLIPKCTYVVHLVQLVFYYIYIVYGFDDCNQYIDEISF